MLQILTPLINVRAEQPMRRRNREKSSLLAIARRLFVLELQ